VKRQSGQSLLEIRGLDIRLLAGSRTLTAVDGLDLSIRHGETFALLGESGCGKSLTALALMRLLPASFQAGAEWIGFDGTDLCALSEQGMRRMRGGRLGMIFQEPMTSLNPVLCIGEQIAEAVRQHDRLKGAAIEARVVELLQAVGIPAPARRAGEYPHQLSGGMKQRVMIAMALAGRPQLLIADEPTTALDVTVQAQVLRLLKALQAQTGMAMLLITHDLGVVAENADRLAVMYAGQIVETGDVKAFFQRPRHPYSRKLFESLPDRDRRDRPLAVIRGAVPALEPIFDGCRFAPRCDLAVARCSREAPLWHAVAPGQGVRCLRYADAPLASHSRQTGHPHAGHSPVAKRAEPLLVVDDLKVHFPIRRGLLQRVVGQVKAVDGVSLSMTPGRSLALVGESGCGKTTLGKAVLQLLPSSGGRVLCAGEDLTRLKGRALRRYRSALQIIFQDPMSAMNPRLRIEKIVAEGMQRLCLNQAQRRQRVVELLDQVGLPAAAASRFPHEFSGGQRQRICIARALAVRPRLIVCDEPTSALDVSVQAQVINLLQRLQRELGLSYLFISHNLSVVAYLADEVAVMYLGRIVERGPVDQVLERPAHPYTRALLSAVPVADPACRQTPIRLAGDMPSPIRPPSGCHFHPRCDLARESCRGAYPPTTELGSGHKASCWLLSASD
jgi:peptide/nickel transport system ATP-binding protein